MNLDDLIALSNRDADLKDGGVVVTQEYKKSLNEYEGLRNELYKSLEMKLDGEIKSFFSNYPNDIKLEEVDGKILVGIGKGDISIEFCESRAWHKFEYKKQVSVKRGERKRIFYIVFVANLASGQSYTEDLDVVDNLLNKNIDELDVNNLNSIKKATIKLNRGIEIIPNLNNFMFEIHDSNGSIGGILNKNKEFSKTMLRLIELTGLFK